MAHIHCAIFKWKEGTLPDDVDAALQLVRDVRDRVEGISAIYCGENTSKHGQGFSHAVVVVGDSQQSIDAYRADSVHEEAAQLIDSMELDGIGVDFVD